MKWAMKRLVFAALLASFAAACGDGTGRVTIVTGDPPALIVYGDETSTEWKTPASAGDGKFEIEVTGPYRVVVVCGGSGRSVLVTQYARTPADARLIEHTCAKREYPFHLRGEMLQESEVAFGDFTRGQNPGPWSFDLPAAVGTFDFVGFFGSLSTGFDQIEIRRDLAITGDVQLGTIDVAQEHTEALVPTRFTAANLDPDEELWSHQQLQSGNTSAGLVSFFHPALAWEIRLVPDAALRTTDGQHVLLMATRSTSSEPAQQRARSVSRRVRVGGPTSVTLMDPLTAIAFDSTAERFTATWTSLPAYDELDLSRVTFFSDFPHVVVHESLFSPAFIASVGATSSTLDFTDVPGFRPEWRHDPTFDQVISLHAFRGASDDDSESSGVSKELMAAPPAGLGSARRRIDARQVFAVADAQRADARRRRTAHPGKR